MSSVLGVIAVERSYFGPYGAGYEVYLTNDSSVDAHVTVRASCIGVS